MKKMVCCMALAGAAFPLLAADAETAEAESPKTLRWNAGGDFRVREEIYDRLPGARGNISKYNNYFRMRGRLWGEVKNEDFTLYARVADEFREYVRKYSSNYGRTPGELILDNLYLDLNNTFWDRVDWRIGRQDFMDGPNARYGAGRLIMDGNPMDGSRAFFSDAVRATVKFDDESKNTLDIFGLYNSHKTFSLGRARPVGDGDYLPMNCIEPWSEGMDEWGGGLYFKSKEWEQIPFELYYIYAQKSSYHLLNGTHMQGRRVHTAGLRVMPKITDDLSAEVEAATQYGENDDSGTIIGGQMGYAGLTYKMPLDAKAQPYTTLAVLYMSGDRQGALGDASGKANRSWDPLWARYTFMESEFYVYRGIYGVGYWSNLMYPHWKVGCKIPSGSDDRKGAFGHGDHEIFASIGPMFAAVKDGAGGGDGDLYGWFLRTRYDFPLLKGFVKVGDNKRGKLMGHVTAELLEPGDYCTSSKMAYFLRWEISVAF